MGVADFLAGWALGSKGGNQGFDEVVASAREILGSDEFQDFVVALRSHAAFALRELGDLVDTAVDEAPSEDIVDFVRALVERRDAALTALRQTRVAPPGG